MSHALTIELSDATFNTLQRHAEAAARSPADLAAAALEQQFGIPKSNGAQPDEKRTKGFESHFGAVNLGDATGVDNEGIDADLAKTYADNHEAG